MTSRAVSGRIPMALHLLQQWRRVLLLLAVVIAGSIAHTLVTTTGAWAAEIERPAHVEHCVGSSCHEGAHHPSECCGGGPCACIFGGSQATAIVVSGLPEPFVHQMTPTGRLREGIDRPPKAMRTRMQSLLKQDTVGNDQDNYPSLYRPLDAIGG